MQAWDEEEPPTNLYDKKTASEMARAAIAASPPARPGPPSPRTAAPELPDFSDVTEDVVEELDERPSRGKKKSMMPIFIGIGAGVFVIAVAVVVVLLLLGKDSKGSLDLKVDPGDGLTVIIDGATQLPGNASPFAIPDMKEGEHKAIIKRAGFKDAEVAFAIAAGQATARQVALEPLATGFFLDTVPPGASIWVDDRPYEDKTPTTITGLTPGKHLVRVAKGDAYEQLNLEVEVAAGQLTQIAQKTLMLAKVEVTFNSEPEGAKVVLISGNDRKELGVAPVAAVIDTSKTYEVEYTLKDYTKITKALEEKDFGTGEEKVQLAAVTLEKVAKGGGGKPPGGGGKPPGGDHVKPPSGGGGGAPGMLSVQTKPWSKVSINGQFIKNTPLVNHPLKPGTYTVTVENPNFNITKTFRVKIKSGEITTLVKTLM
jgi:hypothetical protein